MGTHFCAFKGLLSNILMVFGGNTFIKSEEVSSFYEGAVTEYAF
jgi:hypothetical protein